MIMGCLQSTERKFMVGIHFSKGREKDVQGGPLKIF